MNALRERASRQAASRFLAVASFTSVLSLGPAGAQSAPPISAMQQRSAIYDRVLAPLLLPRHIRTFGFRTELTGDTPYSSKYYKITNITAEVGGAGGVAYAVNNDGRIAYTDESVSRTTGLGQLTGYIVNHGGTFGKLVVPKGAQGGLVLADALNEKGELVGTVFDPASNLTYSTGWRLSGATGSSVAYSIPSTVGSGELYSVNDDEVAVGQYGPGAAAIEGDSHPPGRAIDLLGLRDASCYSTDIATAINDAGEIVGQSCTNQAVRFSLTGYAELIPVGPAKFGSGAQALNQRGDVVGAAGNDAFLYKDGKAVYLPVPKIDQTPTVWGVALGINASDEVVGNLHNVPNPLKSSAFLYVDGRSYDLNTLIPPNSGWTIAGALGINDRGEIVGYGYYNGKPYGISLEPPR